MEEYKEIFALDYEECINYIASKVECDKEIINKILEYETEWLMQQGVVEIRLPQSHWL